MITSMLEGKPSKKLFRLSLPMALSMLFQQLYNLTDTIIVGRVEGANAVSAVGEAYMVTMIFMGIAAGASIGITVVVSRFYGEKKNADVKTAIYTSLISLGALAVVLSVLGAVFSGGVMTLLGAKEAFYDDAVSYLSIYFYGLFFVYIYNCCNGILNALGDSFSVLLFLIFSSVLNVGLDLLFVAVYKWGVAGAAWATLISQAAAALLAVVMLLIKIRKIKCDEKPKVFSSAVLRRICKIALPSILQHSFVSVGNLFVISKVNTFSDEVISAINTALKINTVAIACLVSVSNAASSFTAQNLGAGQIERVKKGARAGVLISWGIAAVFFIPFIIFAPQLVSLFIKMDASVSTTALDYDKIVSTGAMFIRIVSPFYFILCIKTIADGVCRGGEQMVAFLVSTFSDLVIRIALTYLFVLPFFGLNEQAVSVAWAIGWFISTIISLAFYLSGRWKRAAYEKVKKPLE